MAIEKRTYANPEKAKAAMDELSSQGFSEVTTSFKPDRVLVAVNAPFGEGQRAARILDRHGPLASDDADKSARSPSTSPGFDCAALARSATPLSDFMGWSVLKKDYKSPFWPEALSDDPTPLSNKMGWSVLGNVKEGADPATPLSNWLGWSVLKGDDYKSPFFPAALLGDPTPLSNKLGLSVLSEAPETAAPIAVAAPAQAPVPATVLKAEVVQASRASEVSGIEAVPEPAGGEASQDESEPEPPRPGQTKERKRGRKSGRK